MIRFFLFVSLCTSILYAESLRIFVASSAKNAMTQVKEEFLKQYPTKKIELVFGASGKAYQQFLQGLQYDLFFSADAKYPALIASQHTDTSTPQVYALGVVALYASDTKWIQNGLEGLKAKDIKHCSIANPKVAPYGVAAEEILKNTHLYDKLKNKIVKGDNISQAVAFVDTQAAEVGLVAYSLLSDPKKKKRAILIDPSLYTPLEQSFIITQYAKHKPLAKAFAQFVISDTAKTIFKQHGFNVP